MRTRPVVRLRLSYHAFACALAGAVALSALLAAAPTLRVTVLQIPQPALQGAAGFGESVAGLGDVDGDGVGDLVVGAPGADRVYIVSGASRGVLRTIPDPNGTGHRFGFAVATAGDVNGDGIDDVAVGAPGPSPAPLPLPCVLPPCPTPDPSFGRAFVFSGKTGALIHTVVPAEDFAGFGISIAGPGDVNADGVPDLAVGMVPFGASSSIGRVYAFSGATNALLWMVAEPGGKQLPSFGLRLGSIGDLNGDGRRDLLVSAPFHDVNPDPAVSVFAGAVYLLSGATGAIFRTQTSTAPADNALFGSAVAAVGDQNGDGFEDYAIGESGARQVHLMSGKTGASAGTLSSSESGDSYGFTVAAVGDQDGDAHPDFWIGAPGSGKLYLTTWSGSSLAVAADGASPASGGFGWSLAATGNLGGDSPGDLIVGKPGDGGGTGAAFIVLLAANKPPVAKAGADRTIECASPGGTAVLLDGSASSHPDGDALTYEWRDSNNIIVATTVKATVTLGLGTHTFTLKVSDGFGGEASDSVTIVVNDTTPPSLTLALAPSMLWPPNHRLESIVATVASSDACDASPTIQLVSIVSSEPDNSTGDGDTSGDIQDAVIGTTDTSFKLRAERSGGGPGRVYTVTYRAEDASSNTTTATTLVSVPHSQK
jgi:hypothetical protein